MNYEIRKAGHDDPIQHPATPTSGKKHFLSILLMTIAQYKFQPSFMFLTNLEKKNYCLFLDREELRYIVSFAVVNLKKIEEIKK